MAVIKFLKFFVLVQCFLWNIYKVGDELDEATRERMKLRAFYQNWKMLVPGRRDLEQKTQEQSGFAWGALFFGALQQWRFWAAAGVLDLLFGLCWWLGKRLVRSRKDKQEVKPFNAADVGRILNKRLFELQEAFTMMDEMLEFYRISQNCEEKYNAVVAAKRRCDQILAKLK